MEEPEDTKQLEIDIVFALTYLCQLLGFIIYSVYLVLKYLILLLYFTIVDGTYSLLSSEICTKQPISGTKALICGVSDDLSKLLALKLARSNVYLILLDNCGKDIDEALEFLRSQGINRVRGHVVDFSSKSDVIDKAEQLRSDYGELDFLINNLIHNTRCNSSTVLLNAINAFLPPMITRDKGHIITLTSIFGLFGCASKADLSADAHSVIGVMESLRLNLKQTNIKSTVICSSSVKTSKSDEQGSWMFPILEPEYLIQNIVEIMEIAQEFVILPKSGHFLRFIKNITPSRFSDLIFENVGFKSAAVESR